MSSSNDEIRSISLQNTPKPKPSKTKVLEKINKNKVVIDFGSEKTDKPCFFSVESLVYQNDLNKIENNPDTEFMIEESDVMYYDSPVKSKPKKTKTSSGLLNDTISEIKYHKKTKCIEESPFYKLLNESDKYGIEKYQLLAGFQEIDGDEIELNERVY